VRVLNETAVTRGLWHAAAREISLRGRWAISAVDADASSQSYNERPPSIEAGSLVSCVWVQEISSAGSSYEHRTVPNGCAEISCALGTGSIRVSGPKQAPAVQRLPPGQTLVGLRFRPGAASAALATPMSDLVDLEVELERLWGRSALSLGEHMAQAASAADAARLLEQVVIARSADAPERDSLVAAAVKRLQPWQAGDVTQVAAELFISPRQMRRRFLAAFGCGPKTLQRILRFQGFLALSDVPHGCEMTLAQLAHSTGYADQAHLTRECSRLSGLTPSAFLEATRRNCGCSHDHTPSHAGLRHALLSGSASAGDTTREGRVSGKSSRSRGHRHFVDGTSSPARLTIPSAAATGLSVSAKRSHPNSGSSPPRKCR
jgi:AraC-like DNA-binding protein